jgi:hypothetical protein
MPRLISRNLFNSPFTQVLSSQFAERVHAETGADVTDQINRVYELALGHEPNESELEACLAVAEEHGLETVCRVVFNSNEFLFIE